MFIIIFCWFLNFVIDFQHFVAEAALVIFHNQIRHNSKGNPTVFTAVHKHKPWVRAVFALAHKADNLWFNSVGFHCINHSRQLAGALTNAQLAVIFQQTVCRRCYIVIGEGKLMTERCFFVKRFLWP